MKLVAKIDNYDKNKERTELFINKKEEEFELFAKIENELHKVEEMPKVASEEEVLQIISQAWGYFWNLEFVQE